MHVIARKAIVNAIKRHPDAANWLNRWWQNANRARWGSLNNVRVDYPSVDQEGNCLIFDVRGNRYRLICRVSFANEWQRGTLLVKHFLTHAEYDGDFWKKDCKE
jgi:mRNA interferase HigB